ncbi:hypothetical protein F8154_06690 [Alkaliphilus pronyensis]|uniref:Uncharacterized protein n=1 Tax=Alkaliphilus pronyensis TaxID=1482732 RepID=A0A6I0FC76_9FIRM|nr:hypothetical protein [Alkaliphilus pronyensis]KAB3535350.1 hypothetical protein F8154_06690 [Alkaliphilus pronyensis]
MNFESIIIFVIIGILSSIFNKSKQQQRRKPRQQQNTRLNPTKEPTRSNSTTVKKHLGLEDMLKDLHKDINTVFGEYKDTQEAKKTVKAKKTKVVNEARIQPELETYEEDTRSLKETKYTVEDSVANPPNEIGSVYEKEIGDPQIDLSLNESSLVKGIIMSEILGKPKSMQNR